MRSDLAKVCTEKGRSGDRRGHKWALRVTEDYDGPVGRVSHSDRDRRSGFNYSILHKWLRRQVGRPWDAVYSDLKNSSMSAYPVWDNLDYAVALHCHIGADGKIYDRERWGFRKSEVSELYVHPMTRILSWKDRPIHRPKPQPVEIIRLSTDTEYRRIDGIWYYVQIGQTEHDFFIRSAADGTPQFGKSTEYSIVLKQQLSKKELRELAKLL